MHTTALNAADSTGSEPEEPGSSTNDDTPPEPKTDHPRSDDRIRLELAHGDLDPRDADRLSRAVEQVLVLLKRPVEQVGICVVRDPEMSDLHGRWKQKATTTDVVTFDLSDSSNAPLRVDIAICLDEAMRQAAVRGHEPVDELLLYIVHGLLHCCGFDDGDETGSARMHREEDRLLQEIGWGAVYDTGDES